MNRTRTHSIWVLIFLSFLVHEVFAQQVRWEFTNGPWYANIEDFAGGEKDGQVGLYAANLTSSRKTH